MTYKLHEMIDEEVGRYCGDGVIGYGDDEVRVRHLWEERGELVVWLVQFEWIRA